MLSCGRARRRVLENRRCLPVTAGEKERKTSAMLELLYLISPPYYVGSCFYGEGHLLFLVSHAKHQKYIPAERGERASAVQT